LWILPQNKLPRSDTAPDIQRDSADFDDSWESVRIFDLTEPLKEPLKVYVETSSELYKPEYLEFVKKSLDSWSRALDCRLHYAWVDNLKDAQIKVLWVKGFPEKYQHGDTTYQVGDATVRIQTQGLAENVILGDTMHELGHALGIAAHSHSSNDIMVGVRNWKAYNAYTHNQPRLSQNDILAIRRLYSPEWHPGENLYAAIGAKPLAMKSVGQER
jgi:Matrixin